MIETPHSGISELITKYNEKVSRYNYVKLIAKTYSEASCHNLVGQQLRLEAGLFVMEIIENSL
jgi:hypothetical protein